MKYSLARTLLALLATSLTSGALAAPPNGASIKGPDAAIWHVHDGQRRVFPNWETFVLLGTEPVTGVTPAELAAIPAGPDIPNRGEGLPVMSPGGGTIYVIEGGQKRPIVSWNDYLALGFRDGQALVISAAKLDRIPTGPARYGRHPDGVAIKGPDPAIWHMHRGQRRAYPNWETFVMLGDEAVRHVTAAELTTIPMGPAIPSMGEGLPIKGSGAAIYVVEGGKKRHFPSWADYVAYFADGDAVIVGDPKLDRIPTGPVKTKPSGAAPKPKNPDDQSMPSDATTPITALRIAEFDRPTTIVSAAGIQTLKRPLEVVGWDGRRWLVTVSGTELLMAPDGNIPKGVIGKVMRFRAPDGSQQAAWVDGTSFMVAPGGNAARATKVVDLAFESWSGAAASARLPQPGDNSTAILDEPQVLAPPAPLDFLEAFGLVLYEHVNFGGQAYQVTASQLKNLKDVGFNDKASSVRLTAGVAALYKDKDFQGKCTTVAAGELADLKGSAVGNDAVTSIRLGHTCDHDVTIQFKNETWNIAELTIWADGVKKSARLAKGQFLSLRTRVGVDVGWRAHTIEMFGQPNVASIGTGTGVVNTGSHNQFYLVYFEQGRDAWTSTCKQADWYTGCVDEFGYGMAAGEQWY